MGGILNKVERRLKHLFTKSGRASRKITGSDEASSSKSATEPPVDSRSSNSKFSPGSEARKVVPESPSRNSMLESPMDSLSRNWTSESSTDSPIRNSKIPPTSPVRKFAPGSHVDSLSRSSTIPLESPVRKYSAIPLTSPMRTFPPESPMEYSAPTKDSMTPPRSPVQKFTPESLVISPSRKSTTTLGSLLQMFIAQESPMVSQSRNSITPPKSLVQKSGLPESPIKNSIAPPRSAPESPITTLGSLVQKFPPKSPADSPSRNSKFSSTRPGSPTDSLRRNSMTPPRSPARKFTPESPMDSPCRISKFSPAPGSLMHSQRWNSKFCPSSPLRKAAPKSPKGDLKFGPEKRMLVGPRSKTMPILRRKKAGEEEGRGDSGGVALWQKEILMGQRCRPLDFPGVIYYDKNGNLSSTPRRSPVRSPDPQRRSFSFPVLVSSDMDEF